MNDIALNVDEFDNKNLPSLSTNDSESDSESTVVESDAEDVNVISLSTFVSDFGKNMLESVRKQNPPVYNDVPDASRAAIMDNMIRRPFDAQQRVVQAVTRLLVDVGEKSAVINAEMGTGKVRRIGA